MPLVMTVLAVALILAVGAWLLGTSGGGME